MTFNPETFVGYVPQPDADPIQVQAKHLLVECYDVLAGRDAVCVALRAIELLASTSDAKADVTLDAIRLTAQCALEDFDTGGAWIDAVHTILREG